MQSRRRGKCDEKDEEDVQMVRHKRTASADVHDGLMKMILIFGILLPLRISELEKLSEY